MENRDMSKTTGETPAAGIVIFEHAHDFPVFGFALSKPPV